MSVGKGEQWTNRTSSVRTFDELNIARREASLEFRVSLFAPDHANTLAL